MTLKPQIEAIIYAVEEPVTLDQLATLLHDYMSVLDQQGRVPLDPDFNESSAPPAAAQLAAYDGYSSPDGAPSTSATAQPAAYDGYGDDDAQSTGAAQPDAASESSRSEDASATARHVSAGADATDVTEPRRDDTPPPRAQLKRHKQLILDTIAELIADYAHSDRGIEIREVAGGYRMSTKPEHHDLVRAFASGLKPPIRLSLPALETLAVIAYKQPVTAPEISEIRGVDTSGVLASLISRKLITTAGRKPVIGRPILYKTTKEFLLRFGLKDISELPSMEEFEKLTSQSDLFDTPESERGTVTSPSAFSESRSDDTERARHVSAGSSHENLGESRSHATALPDTPAEPDPFSVE